MQTLRRIVPHVKKLCLMALLVSLASCTAIDLRDQQRLERIDQQLNRFDGELIEVSVSPLSIQDLSRLAVLNSPAIASSNFNFQASLSGVLIAKSAWYPELTYGVSPSFSGGGVVDIGIRQTLFDFGINNAKVAAAESQKELRFSEFLQEMESTLDQAFKAYIDYSYALSNEQAAWDHVDKHREILRRVEARVKHGVSSESELTTGGISLRQAEMQHSAAMLDLDVARINLFQHLGTNVQSTWLLSEIIDYFLQRKSDYVLENIPKYQMALTALEYAKANERLAHASRFPRLSLVLGTRGVSTGGISFDWVESSGVELQGSSSFSFDRRFRIEEQELLRRSAEQSLVQIERELDTFIKVLEETESNTSMNIEVAKNVLSSNEQLQDIIWQEYLAGRRSLNDVGVAAGDLYDSQRRVLQLKRNLANTVVSAVLTTGIINGVLDINVDADQSIVSR